MTEQNITPSFDLGDLLTQIRPNILTPKLNTLATTKNDKKPKTVAQLLVTHLHSGLTNPVAKQILHKGEVHTIRYFDIEPLMRGVWAEMSLLLLHLSYAEQCDLIDALYPEDVKLTAKAFAINFTNDNSPLLITHTRGTNDQDITSRLDATNVGIAMILATLTTSLGGSIPAHPDLIAKFGRTMATVAEEAKRREKTVKNNTRKEQADRHRDNLSR